MATWAATGGAAKSSAEINASFFICQRNQAGRAFVPGRRVVVAQPRRYFVPQ
jgi:hypothetical protein